MEGQSEEIMKKYPPGTRMYLEGDYPWNIREVDGYEIYGEHMYLVFKDGGHLNVEREELIVKTELPEMHQVAGLENI